MSNELINGILSIGISSFFSLIISLTTNEIKNRYSQKIKFLISGEKNILI